MLQAATGRIYTPLSSMKKTKMKTLILLFATLLATGCATVDKAMQPVDKVVHGTESTYQSVSNSVSETWNDISEGATDLKAGFLDSSVSKAFMSDSAIAENREKNYIAWSSGSTYTLDRVLRQESQHQGIEDAASLETTGKMKLLKDYFFSVKKLEHARKFSAKHKKPEFDEFLTDRENIEKIHEYKMALAEAEHEWRIGLGNTQKQVAQLMLSTLYAKPVAKYVSYDPYKEEMFLSIESTIPGFKQQVKIDADKEKARNLKNNINAVRPYVFFDIDNNALEFLGISLRYNKDVIGTDLADKSYTRQSDIVFTSEDISLKSLDVQYYNVVKNVKPPEWFNNLPASQAEVIGYGEGLSTDEAKKEAFNEIAMSLNTTVSATIKSEQSVVGDTKSTNFSSSTQQDVAKVSIKGSKVRKTEKKDGIWFVAVSYNP